MLYVLCMGDLYPRIWSIDRLSKAQRYFCSKKKEPLVCQKALLWLVHMHVYRKASRKVNHGPVLVPSFTSLFSYHCKTLFGLSLMYVYAWFIAGPYIRAAPAWQCNKETRTDWWADHANQFTAPWDLSLSLM